MSSRTPISAGDLLSGIKGQRVLVTAGAAGIGFAMAETLSRLGARIAICDVSEDALAEARRKLAPEVAELADVSSEEDVDRLFAEITRAFGGLDALINNAGIAGPTSAVEDLEPADWRRCLDIGLTGQFLCVRRAVPMLKATGGGSIVSMSSAAGRLGYAYRTPYSAAKFGVIGFTQSLAKELGPHGIRVNAILPGVIEGARIESVIGERARQLGISHEEMKDRYLTNISLRRMTNAYDVAATVAIFYRMRESTFRVNLSGSTEMLRHCE